MQQVASYRSTDGTLRYIMWNEGRFFIDGYEVGLEHVLEWDRTGALAWVSPETQTWARSLAQPQPAPVAQPQPATQSQSAPDPQPQPTAAARSAPEPGTRAALLADILATLAQYPGYTAKYGTDTDIRIDNQVADASWGTGKKKIEFSAHMKAVEPERTLYYFEVLKEKGAGFSFGGLESESYSTLGAKRSGKTEEVVIGPGGVAMNAEWDYAATRQIIESVAARHGWRVKVVLTPGAAKYQRR